MLISFSVTAKLICVFVFAYSKIWFSHDRDDEDNIVSLVSKTRWAEQFEVFSDNMTRPEVYTFFMLRSIEVEIYPAHKF